MDIDPGQESIFLSTNAVQFILFLHMPVMPCTVLSLQGPEPWTIRISPKGCEHLSTKKAELLNHGRIRERKPIGPLHLPPACLILIRAIAIRNACLLCSAHATSRSGTGSQAPPSRPVRDSKTDACKRSPSRESATSHRAFQANPCVSPLPARHRKDIELFTAMPLITSLRQNAGKAPDESSSSHMYSLRLATSSCSSTGLGFFALGRLGGRRGGGAAPAAGLLVAPAAAAANGGRRSVSATPNASSPVPGDQGVGMDPAKQQQQHKPPPHAPAGNKENDRDDMHKTHGDVMTHSFGEGYSTRSDEEGFGGVYGQNDPVFNPGTEVHPNHPEYDRSQGSEVKEKEKARHLKDDKHAT